MTIYQTSERRSVVRISRPDEPFSVAWFGGDRAVAGASDLVAARRYTSQLRDDSGSGNGRKELYYYNARWYLAGVGMFTQPDTVVPGAGNPQALNRYAYALNNPMRFVDPTGHVSTDGSAGGSKDPIDWSLAEFEAASWDQRKAWLAQFQSEYKTQGWFNNFRGILDYFSQSPAYQHSSYIQNADAGVLHAINEGMAAQTGRRALPDGADHDAASKWQAFFAGLSRSSTASFAELSAKWGAAESAGVTYGLSIAGPATGQEARTNAVFVGAGDFYRSSVTTGWPVSLPIGLGSSARVVTFRSYPFDPRRDDGFVDTASRIFEGAESGLEWLASNTLVF